MIVNRRTFTVKWGRMEEVVALIKAEIKRVDFPHAWRIYTPGIGAFSVLAIEGEYENLEEYERFWAEYSSSPEGVEANEKLATMLVEGGANEIWTLVE